MKLKSSLIAIAGLALVAVLFAQTGQSNQSSSQSQSGNGQSSSSSSSSGRAWSSSGGGKSVSGGTSVNGRGSGSGNGNGSGYGLNATPTHAILYTLESSVETVEAKELAMGQHIKYLGENQNKGKVLIYGPWRDLPGSMAVVVAKSDAEATEIAKNDPAVKSGALTFEVRAWLVQTPGKTVALR